MRFCKRGKRRADVQRGILGQRSGMVPDRRERWGRVWSGEAGLEQVV